MTKITVLPHLELCPDGAVIEARKGESLCKSTLKTGLILIMPVAWPVPARPATLSYGKVMSRSILRTSMKRIDSIRPGDWKPIHGFLVR